MHLLFISVFFGKVAPTCSSCECCGSHVLRKWWNFRTKRNCAIKPRNRLVLRF